MQSRNTSAKKISEGVMIKVLAGKERRCRFELDLLFPSTHELVILIGFSLNEIGLIHLFEFSS